MEGNALALCREGRAPAGAWSVEVGAAAGLPRLPLVCCTTNTVLV